MDDAHGTTKAPPGRDGRPEGSAGDAAATRGATAPSDGQGEPHDVVRREGVVTAHGSESNRLLHALPLAEYEWLLPQLIPVRLRLKEVLIEPDRPIPHVWFPRDGVASVIASGQEGGDIEVGTIGCDGLVGLPVLLGDDTMPNRVFVQIEGDGWRLPADTFRRVLDERPAIRKLCLRYAAYYTAQLSQSVACNKLHTLEERAARWLLMTHDRVHGNTFELTHEFLSLMLGVRRAGVSVAMGVLQSAGVLQYSRGRVEVLDRAKLEEASCDCYQITRTALDRLLA